MEGKALKIDGSGGAKEFRWVGDKGKATAMAGWGHLVCPFCAAAKWRCAAVNSDEWCRPSERRPGRYNEQPELVRRGGAAPGPTGKVQGAEGGRNSKRGD